MGGTRDAGRLYDCREPSSTCVCAEADISVHLLDSDYTGSQPPLPRSDHQRGQRRAIPPKRRHTSFHKTVTALQSVFCAKLLASRRRSSQTGVLFVSGSDWPSEVR